MPTSTINNVQIFWELTGNSGDPLVLVHGSWGDHHNWDAVVQSLSRSFRVLTYDRRGHSRSERPTSTGSVGEDAADLAALLEELELGPAHIVGHSFGGSIVLRLAVERPDLFRSLTVHEPPLLNLLANESNMQVVLQTVKERIGAIVELLMAGDMEGGARQFFETVAFGPGAWEQMPPHAKKLLTFNAPTFLDEMLDPEAFSLELARLRAFSCPALLTLGGQSPAFFAPVVERVSAVLPKVQQKVYPEAGHAPEGSHPELYAETLATFIGQLHGSVDQPVA